MPQLYISSQITGNVIGMVYRKVSFISDFISFEEFYPWLSDDLLKFSRLTPSFKSIYCFRHAKPYKSFDLMQKFIFFRVSSSSITRIHYV
jgi:hypothetical protein